MDESYNQIIEFLSDSSFTPSGEAELDSIEKELGLRFPNSYRKFQLDVGDFCHESIEVFTTGGSTICSENILEIRKYISKYGDDVFFQAYNGEVPVIPESFIPFSCSEKKYYYFDLGNLKNGECPVVLWEEMPTRVADNFVEWFNKEIDKIRGNA